MEVVPDGVYLSDHLEDVIEHRYKKLRDEANQSQMVASGWIAIPEAYRWMRRTPRGSSKRSAPGAS